MSFRDDGVTVLLADEREAPVLAAEVSVAGGPAAAWYPSTAPRFSGAAAGIPNLASSPPGCASAVPGAAMDWIITLGMPMKRSPSPGMLARAERSI